MYKVIAVAVIFSVLGFAAYKISPQTYVVIQGDSQFNIDALSDRWLQKFTYHPPAALWVDASNSSTPIKLAADTIYQVSDRAEYILPTAAEKQAAQTLTLDSYSHAVDKNLFDYQNAIEQGYVRMDLDPLHYFNEEYATDDEILNPNKPEFLMFYPTEKGMLLAGVMYLMPTVNQNGPQIGGNITRWHFHTWGQKGCLVNGVLRDSGDSCLGIQSEQSPQMLHVWFVDHPDGAFSTDMCLPANVLEGWDGHNSLMNMLNDFLSTQ